MLSNTNLKLIIIHIISMIIIITTINYLFIFPDFDLLFFYSI